MTTLLLSCWTRANMGVQFDPSDGRGARVRLRSAGERTAGVAHRHRGVWHAVYRVGADLVFQFGATRVRISPEVRSELQVEAGRRTMRLCEEERVVFAVAYRLGLLTRLVRHLDPTWDQLDEDSADFFYWLAGQWEGLARGGGARWSDTAFARSATERR
jgi:hypothetical protein